MPSVVRRLALSSRRGFTIVELLVATAVTLALAALLVGVTRGVLDVWTTSSGNLGANNQAKLILDRLERDLQSMVVGRGDDVWFAVTIQRDQSPVNAGRGDAGPFVNASFEDDGSWNPTYAAPPGGILKPTVAELAETLALAPASRRLDDYRFGQAGVWLRFFAGEPDTNGALNNLSGPRAIGYQVVRLPVRNGFTAHTSPAEFPDVRWALFRTRVRVGPHTANNLVSRARSSLGVGYNILAPAFSEPTTGAEAAQGEPGQVRRPWKFNDILGNNVVDFGVRVFTRNPDGSLELVFPTDANFANPAWAFVGTATSTADPINPNVGPAGAPAIRRGIPAVVEVMVRVLTEEGARRVRNVELGRLPPPPEYPNTAAGRGQFWWDTVEAHSKVFTRRIEIPAQPL
jgi:type II secretory pathway pseudopilin PulG